MLPNFPNVLMIGSDARKAGKTTLITKIIEKFSSAYPVFAVKVALYDDISVFHEHYPEASSKEIFEISEEAPGDKDSGKYFQAGAKKSMFIAAMDSQIPNILNKFVQLLMEGGLMIVESTTLRKYMVPGIFLMVYGENSEMKSSAESVKSLSDWDIQTGSEEFSNIEQYLCVEQDYWVFC